MTNIKYAVYGAIVGAVLSIAALIVVVLESGYAHASFACTILVYVAFWPALIFGSNLSNLFVSFWTIPANIIVWALLAFIIGAIKRGNRNGSAND